MKSLELKVHLEALHLEKRLVEMLAARLGRKRAHWRENLWARKMAFLMALK